LVGSSGETTIVEDVLNRGSGGTIPPTKPNARETERGIVEWAIVSTSDCSWSRQTAARRHRISRSTPMLPIGSASITLVNVWPLVSSATATNTDKTTHPTVRLLFVLVSFLLWNL